MNAYNRNTKHSSLNCGTLFKPKLPTLLKPSNPPIVLAEVTVQAAAGKARVFINYSSIIVLSQMGSNVQFANQYRLVRKGITIKILKGWTVSQFVSRELPFEGIEVNSSSVPFVVQYCDSLRIDKERPLIYQLQLVRVLVNNTKYKITNKNLTGLYTSNQVC
ncbi:hypothetical protein [Marininema halotolerans]|uniref:Uncharacterized protein n=1 Tax=Marininema halotolerans TaxID=1155944 RepID=A0A1I6R6X4_9BACL|nr:hypothetical protein [Marininema halotolerans]SFS60472.1 hypothetical protein SAMN05444972_104201 [Marininema halotolerans]